MTLPPAVARLKELEQASRSGRRQWWAYQQNLRTLAPRLLEAVEIAVEALDKIRDEALSAFTKEMLARDALAHIAELGKEAP